MNQEAMKEAAGKIGSGVEAGVAGAWTWGSTHLQISIPIVTFVLGFVTHWIFF